MEDRWELPWPDKYTSEKRVYIIIHDETENLNSNVLCHCFYSAKEMKLKNQQMHKTSN